MNMFITGSVVAFSLFAMGIIALMLGRLNAIETKSKAGREMFMVCLAVFFWDFGYAWMSLCYGSDFAYIARAIALLAVDVYMFFILCYVSTVTKYPMSKLRIILVLFSVLGICSWFMIIQKNAVDFVQTYWGYWYQSKMSYARIIQFISIILSFVQYYVMISYGKKHAVRTIDRYVLSRFQWFGPILFVGYILDTLVPSILKIPAIPGSAISAFVSAMILFRSSQNNKVFGLSQTNVAQYVFKDVKIPVIITDNDGRMVLYNDVTASYLGCEEEELKKHDLMDFFSAFEDDAVSVVNSDRKCILDKTEVKDRFGDLHYSIYFVNDITKERQIRHMLEESRIVAEEANQAKSNFLANMSHEIRTPMNAIIGMSDIILQDDELSGKAQEHVKEIQVAGHNLLGIINDILDISKIEAQKYDIVDEKYELASLLQDVSRMTEVRLQEGRVAYVLKLEESLPRELIGDVGRIRQILLNILGNAVKFCKKGSITLDVSWNHNQEYPVLYFDIKDTGIGIKPENLSTIFGEFNQVDTRKNRNIQGTGLGLAISKRLAELMDGTITVESEYGVGSTFHIRIHQKLEEYGEIGKDLVNSLQNNEYHAEEKKKEIVQLPRPDKKVLIVDDNRVNLMVAKGIIKRYQVSIDTAESGQDAIEKVKENEYDIIFMDHMMPEMDGIEASKIIRELGDAYVNIPIIALTANALAEAKEEFLQAGLQDFVAKPIDVAALNEVMDRWLPVNNS